MILALLEHLTTELPFHQPINLFFYEVTWGLLTRWYEVHIWSMDSSYPLFLKIFSLSRWTITLKAAIRWTRLEALYIRTLMRSNLYIVENISGGTLPGLRLYYECEKPCITSLRKQSWKRFRKRNSNKRKFSKTNSNKIFWTSGKGLKYNGTAHRTHFCTGGKGNGPRNCEHNAKDSRVGSVM